MLKVIPGGSLCGKWNPVKTFDGQKEHDKGAISNETQRRRAMGIETRQKAGSGEWNTAKACNEHWDTVQECNVIWKSGRGVN